MEKVYNVSVNISWQYDTRDIETEWKPTTLFKTIDGAQKYKSLLYESFCKEFPKLKHAITENHAAVWEESKPYAGFEYEPLYIGIYINELEIHE